MVKALFFVIGLGFAVFLGAGNVLAASSQEMCEDGSTAPDIRLAACARWMQSGRLTAYGRYVALQNRAFAFEKKGQLDEAISEWTNAIAADPKQANGYYNRGTIWAQKKNYNSAIADYNRAIEIDPKWLRYFIMRGNAYGSKGDHASAIADYSEAIRINPKDDTGYFNRALQYQAQRKFDSAFADFNKAIELDPKDAKYLYFRAGAKAETGDLNGAIEDYNEAGRLKPKAWDVRNGRGLIYLKKGDADLALTDFSSAIELQPTALPPRNNRGNIWLQKGELDKAQADFDEVIRASPNGPLALSRRCFLFAQKRDYDAALKDCNAAIAAVSDFQLAYAYRGLVFEEKGETERARADFEKASSGKGEYDTSDEARALASKRLAALAPASTSPPAPVAAILPSASNPPPQVLPSSPAVSANAPAGRRVALVIGNSSYQNVQRLANPSRDAATVAAVLEKIGFQHVALRMDLDREHLIDALRAFAKEAETADWAMVYYAGHGIEAAGVNYLIPVDARLRSDRDVGLETISIDQVLNAAERATALRLVILDACRDNPFANQMKRTMTMASRSVGRGLAKIEPDPGTLVVFAAKHGETALDGDGGNSPFVTALVKDIQTPGIEIRRLFDNIRDDVMDMTGRRQQPYSYGSVPGRQDFYFVSK